MATVIEPGELPRLADILGQTDAVFAPVRTWKDGSSSNAWFARREYPASGIRWDAGGTTAAERQRHGRWAAAAAERGLVERFAAGVYATRLRLTEAAELAVRARCGLPGLESAASLVREVASFRWVGRSSWSPERVWVPEHPELTGPEDLRVTVETMAYPALLRGWLVAGSDLPGLVSYAVGPVALPATVPADPAGEFDDALRTAWASGLRMGLANLAVTNEATRRELGGLPLPASAGSVRKAKAPRGRR